MAKRDKRRNMKLAMQRSNSIGAIGRQGEGNRRSVAVYDQKSQGSSQKSLSGDEYAVKAFGSPQEIDAERRRRGKSMFEGSRDERVQAMREFKPAEKRKAKKEKKDRSKDREKDKDKDKEGRRRKDKSERDKTTTGTHEWETGHESQGERK